MSRWERDKDRADTWRKVLERVPVPLFEMLHKEVDEDSVAWQLVVAAREIGRQEMCAALAVSDERNLPADIEQSLIDALHEVLRKVATS